MTTRFIAHRGASGYRPEHTRAAYRLAFELGADAVEPDLVLSRDGVVVIRHEHELSGSTDVAQRAEFAHRRRMGFGETGPVDGWFTEDFDWAELATLRAREPRPTIRPASAAFDGLEGLLRFRDLLEMLDSDAARSRTGEPTMLVAELKHANEYAALGIDLPNAVLSEVIDAGWRHNDPRLVFESFEPEPLRALAGWGSRILLLDNAHWPEDVFATAAEFDGVSFEVDRLQHWPTLPAELHARGLQAFAYTLRPENVSLPSEYQTDGHPAEFGNWQPWFRHVLGCGLDAVFVDHPDLPELAVGLDA